MVCNFQGGFHMLLRNILVYHSCREGFKIHNISLHPYEGLSNGEDYRRKLTMFFQKSKFIKHWGDFSNS